MLQGLAPIQKEIRDKAKARAGARESTKQAKIAPNSFKAPADYCG